MWSQYILDKWFSKYMYLDWYNKSQMLEQMPHALRQMDNWLWNIADYYLLHDSIGNHSQSMYKHFLVL